MADPKNALDAMSEALASKTETPAADTSADEADDAADDNDEPDAGDEVAELAPDGDKVPAAEGDSESKDDKGEVADGKPAKDDAGKKPAADAAKKDDKPAEGADKKPAADPAAKKPDAKTADPVNDPIDPRLGERTQTRVKSLIDMVKERDTEVAQGRELFEQISSTGMSPEELGTMLGYARLVHSENIEDKRTAFKFLQGELRGLALQLGETAAGVNMLDDYPDIKEQLEAGTITEKAAQELVLSREHTKANTAHNTRQQETAAELQTARTKGVADMDELGETLKGIDPQYAAKAAILIPKLQPVLAKLHPSQWVKKFRDEYKAFKLPAPAAGGAAPGAPAGGVKPQPLRPGQPSGNSAAQPSNAREAMDAALSSMGR